MGEGACHHLEAVEEVDQDRGLLRLIQIVDRPCRKIPSLVHKEGVMINVMAGRAEDSRMAARLEEEVDLQLWTEMEFRMLVVGDTML